jgi:hypothetical protein
MDEVLLGAFLASALGAVAFLFQRWYHLRDEQNRERAGRLAEFGAASWATTLDIVRLARAPAPQKKVKREEMEAKADRIDSAEVLILLRDDAAVFDAARAVDRCQAELTRHACEKEWNHDEWLAFSKSLLSPVVDMYCTAAQAAMGKKRPIQRSFSQEIPTDAE